jgi:hypothetical protein
MRLLDPTCHFLFPFLLSVQAQPVSFSVEAQPVHAENSDPSHTAPYKRRAKTLMPQHDLLLISAQPPPCPCSASSSSCSCIAQSYHQMRRRPAPASPCVAPPCTAPPCRPCLPSAALTPSRLAPLPTRVSAQPAPHAAVHQACPAPVSLPASLAFVLHHPAAAPPLPSPGAARSHPLQAARTESVRNRTDPPAQLPSQNSISTMRPRGKLGMERNPLVVLFHLPRFPRALVP